MLSCVLFTGDSSNFIGCMTASESRHMSPEAVANQVDVLKRHVGGLLESINECEKYFS